MWTQRSLARETVLHYAMTSRIVASTSALQMSLCSSLTTSISSTSSEISFEAFSLRRSLATSSLCTSCQVGNMEPSVQICGRMLPLAKTSCSAGCIPFARTPTCSLPQLMLKLQPTILSLAVACAPLLPPSASVFLLFCCCLETKGIASTRLATCCLQCSLPRSRRPSPHPDFTPCTCSLYCRRRLELLAHVAGFAHSYLNVSVCASWLYIDLYPCRPVWTTATGLQLRIHSYQLHDVIIVGWQSHSRIQMTVLLVWCCL
jgi:hypothetical protein